MRPLCASVFKGFYGILTCIGILSCAVASNAQDIAFTHVTVIDGTNAQPRVDRTVVIRGNRIIAEGPAASTAVPANSRTIDGRGKFLIPGLWDMHVHLAMPGGKDVLPLYIANGVTGVRDMAGEWPTLTAWRRDVSNGSVIGPRIVASGPYLEGGDVPIPHILIKVHGQLTRESYFAIARAARAKGIPFAGHVSRVVGAADASDSGQASIEHILSIPNACTPAESVSLAPRYPTQAALGRCSSASLAPLFAKLRANGTRVVPTLVAQLEVARWPKRDLPGDSVQRYLPDSMRKYVAEIFPMVDSVPPDADVVGLQLFEKRVAMAALLHKAGVAVLVGTDAPLRNSPPGFGLHEEMLLLTRAGMTPYEVIRAATIESARFIGLADSLGTIEVGKVADVVLLAANPLADIRNSSRTEYVVANGRVHQVRRDTTGRLIEVLRDRM